MRHLAQITPEDIDKLLSIARHDPDKIEYDATLNNYLSLANQVFGNSTLLSLGDTVETRQQRYEVYDEMDESVAYISSALDILSDDATQPDDSGVVMTIISENAKVKSIIEDLFADLEIEGKLSKWARVIAKYGDFFLEVNADQGKGITSINDTIYPGSVERRDLEGKLIAFIDTFGTTTVESIHAPWDYIHFRLKGDIFKSHRQSQLSALDKSAREYNLTSSYGQSILRPAIKVYAQLRFVENLIILSRLTNSIKRNIFLINTGETDPTKAFETIRNYADLLKKDISLDIEKGVYNSQKHTVTYDEDIFIPVNDTKNDVRIESIGGDVNIAEQYDLEYLLNKLFASLKIPKAYLNYEQDLNARSTLIQLDIRYARSVGQLQVALIGGLLRLAKIHLAHLGINPDTVDLDIQLTNVSSIDKETRLEQKKVSMETARTFWDMIVTMNDKLSAPAGGSNPFTAAEGPSDSPQESKLDLEYVTEHILSKYFELSQEDIDHIMKNSIKESEGSTRPVGLRDRKSYPNSDLKEMYPIQNNPDNFVSLKESIINNLNETLNESHQETKDF